MSIWLEAKPFGRIRALSRKVRLVGVRQTQGKRSFRGEAVPTQTVAVITVLNWQGRLPSRPLKEDTNLGASATADKFQPPLPVRHCLLVLKLRVAHASRLLVKASRFHELCIQYRLESISVSVTLRFTTGSAGVIRSDKVSRAGEFGATTILYSSTCSTLRSLSLPSRLST
jgi:hypothetical protein